MPMQGTTAESDRGTPLGEPEFKKVRCEFYFLAVSILVYLIFT